MTGTPASAPNVPLAAGESYENWFVLTPDPWAAAVRLEHGSDRSLVRSIEEAARHGDPSQAPALEKQLLAVLAAEGCTDAARMFVVRLLALVGARPTVTALAPWLRDPARADLARYALDAIPDHSVDVAYREALADVRGAVRIGLIGSIALRNDSEAVPVLHRIAADSSSSADERAAATRAVSRLSRAG